MAVLELLETKSVKLDARLTSTRRTVEVFLETLPQYLEHPWTLPEMAQQCGLGTSAFAEYCREVTNLPPMKFLAQCRVESARKLLREQRDLSVTDIAFACGFQTTQYFATVFRQHTGCNPSEFRNSNGGRPR